MNNKHDEKIVRDIIEHCMNLHADVNYNYVRDWKKRNSANAIAYLPVYAPKEIIHAAGMLSVGFMGGGDMIEIIQGDSYFQSYICHIVRSIVDMGLSGKIDCFDGLICPSICDTIRNMTGTWGILFPDKYSKYLDLPQNFDVEVGGRFYESHLREISEELEAYGGENVDNDKLNHSIGLFNKNRRLLIELDQLRSDKPWVVPVEEYYLLNKASNILDVEENNRMMEEYLNAVVELDRRPIDNIRVLLLGGFCEQPPLGLLKTIEMAGCYIVWDDLIIGNRFILSDIDDTTDKPFRALANAYITDSNFSSSKYEIDTEDKSKIILRIIEERKADGAILTGPSFCDPILLDHPGYFDALDNADIPYISFLFSEDLAQYAVIDEEVGTFSDSIRLWR